MRSEKNRMAARQFDSITENIVDDSSPGTPLLPDNRDGNDRLAEAMQAANRGEFSLATELCRDYLNNAPQHATAYCLMGLILQSQEQFDEARKHYERALYLDPEHAESLTHLMLDSQRIGDRASAANYARRLQRLKQRSSSGSLEGDSN